MHKLEDLQAKLKANPAEGEPPVDRLAILHEARLRREADTGEYDTIRIKRLERARDQDVQRLRPGESQHMGHIAIDQVTGEHRIPVIVSEHPDTLH